MTLENFYIDELDWAVFVIHSVNEKDINSVKTILHNFNCSKEDIDIAANNIKKSKYDFGYIHNNVDAKLSIIIIGESSSFSQFANTVVHETLHLIRFLSNYFDMSEEDCANFLGNFTMRILDRIQLFYNKL